MPKSKSGGRLKASKTEPIPFSQRDTAETEVKYFGLVRDEALNDLESNDKALAEVLKDIQDPAEASTLGAFKPTDLQILDGIDRYGLKKEDFEILVGASISTENADGVTAPLVNPRQRIADRIGQAERFAGRGTIYQGQGTVLYKYSVPEDEPLSSTDKYSHTNPPPFFTEDITSTIENSADFIPSTEEQIINSHRIGYIENGVFVPDIEEEYWWSGEYNHDMRSYGEYGNSTQTALTNPKFPIVRDGNMKFDQIYPRGINTKDNWGLRFDFWFKKADFDSNSTMMRWAAQVNGHLRIDYFEKSGYNSTTGAIEGTWRTALNTADPNTHYVQFSRENPTSTEIGSRVYYVQGGPTTTIGSGNGTLPTQRSMSNGGALDLSLTYQDREGNNRSNFEDDYVPVIIRFWYGQTSTDENENNIFTKEPGGSASFFIETIETNASTSDLYKWNDYSAQLKLKYSSSESAWYVDTSESVAEEDNFSNFNETFEIAFYTNLDASTPTSLSDYITPSTAVIANTEVSGSVTYATFSIPGASPSNDQTIWIIARNRPFNVIPGTSSIYYREMWERYIFNPNPTGLYKSAYDLLEGVGKNYVEPDPRKVSFEENLDLYKAFFGNLPELNTYTASRYDGFIPNSITTSNTSRDYDYNHSKLMFIGRQKKGTTGEIGTTTPYLGKDLVTGETRTKGENYTFIEVVRNEAGFGGSVTINAYPTNNLGIYSAGTSGTFGKMLHLTDNTTTFPNPSRQNISTISVNELPSDTDFASTSRILYEEIDGQGRLYLGTWDGTTFTRDTSGVIAAFSMGASSRSHDAKSGFITGFTKGTSDYSFYGLIGAQRNSFSGVSLTVESGGTTISAISGIFSKDSNGTNNDQYIGSEIEFSDGSKSYVTGYDASTEKVTISPAKTAENYTNCSIWYNFFQLGGTLPSNIVDSVGANTSRSSVLGSGISDRLIQIKYVFNSGYQYSRTDGGSGLSFSETLYVNIANDPTQVRPFSSDTELPAPPADIVVPFGYDNIPSSSDPGLGGLCYPPYSIQDIDLQPLAVSDSTLYSKSEGQYDIWWGSRIRNQSTMDGRYLYVTDKLMFDFSNSERNNLLQSLTTSDKPTFTGSEYTHKLEIELNVGLPQPASGQTNHPTQTNKNIYNDVKLHSNNKPVKDKYYLFVQKSSGGNDLSVLSANSPNWT